MWLPNLTECFPSVSNAIDCFPSANASQIVPYDSADPIKFDELCDGNKISLAVENYVKNDLGKTGKLLNKGELVEGGQVVITVIRVHWIGLIELNQIAIFGE